MMNTIEKLTRLNIELEGLLHVLAHRDSENVRASLRSKYLEYKEQFDGLFAELNKTPLKQVEEQLQDIYQKLTTIELKEQEAAETEVEDETDQAVRAIERGEKKEADDALQTKPKEGKDADPAEEFKSKGKKDAQPQDVKIPSEPSLFDQDDVVPVSLGEIAEEKRSDTRILNFGPKQTEKETSLDGGQKPEKKDASNPPQTLDFLDDDSLTVFDLGDNENSKLKERGPVKENPDSVHSGLNNLAPTLQNKKLHVRPASSSHYNTNSDSDNDDTLDINLSGTDRLHRQENPTIDTRLNDTIERGESVSQMIARRAASDLKRVFTLNDKMRFRRTLFNLDDNSFQEALAELAVQKTFADAMNVVVGKYGWHEDDAEVEDFMSIIKPHFKA